MKLFLINAFVKPGLSILFCLVFGLPFVFFGFQSVELIGVKDAQGQVEFTVIRGHFWGVIKDKRVISNVERATKKEDSLLSTRPGSAGIDRKILSKVVLVSMKQNIPIFTGSTDIDDAMKNRVISEVNEFIQETSKGEYRNTFKIRNVFGWVGLPFVVLGFYGLITWPHRIVGLWKGKGKKSKKVRLGVGK